MTFICPRLFDIFLDKFMRTVSTPIFCIALFFWRAYIIALVKPFQSKANSSKMKNNVGNACVNRKHKRTSAVNVCVFSKIQSRYVHYVHQLVNLIRNTLSRSKNKQFRPVFLNSWVATHFWVEDNYFWVAKTCAL